MIKINIVRKIIFNILNEVEIRHKKLDNVTERHVNKLSQDIDRNFVIEVVHGVLRYKLLLDYYIDCLTVKKLVDIKIKNILRMALYEIIFLDKVPNYATINENVEIAKLISIKMSGLVNAILRNYLREKDNLDNKIDSIKLMNKIEYISITKSYPKWMVEYFIKSYGHEKTELILDFLNTRPYVTVKINKFKKIPIEDLLGLLNKEGIEYDLHPLNNEIIIIKKGNVRNTSLYKDGFLYFQDPAATLPVYRNIEVFKSANHVLDLCAAPGGKSFNVAEMSDKLEVVACDISQQKIETLRGNVNRLGFNNIKIIQNDALEINERFINKFDICLCDLPCSGLGTIRKKPDIKWNKTYDHIIQLQQIQLSILNNAEKYIKKNGIIIYSTCTLGDIENSQVVKNFLENHPNFKQISSEEILPYEWQSDGFFISVLMKEE